ncbi:jg15766 [Pararge aegeria aegeria]|uniref:Jg15766 protein n=1 Tax=Pararge aegeria aegeria TaxID=348720 RepID=A0A8S4RMF5_9NEOP|nr:jg15766 [Pararge aegeria aegeria]
MVTKRTRSLLIHSNNMTILLVCVALLVGSVNSSNSTIPADEDDTCEAPIGLWSLALEDWATSTRVQSDRHGRVMALPSTKGYYVTERFDSPYLSPPPPAPSSPGHIPPAPGHAPHAAGAMPVPNQPPHAMRAPQGYKEWEGTPPAGGKIVNRPTKPYKDKFKPSYVSTNYLPDSSYSA